MFDSLTNLVLVCFSHVYFSTLFPYYSLVYSSILTCFCPIPPRRKTNTVDTTVTLRRSARLIARQQRLAEEEKAKVSASTTDTRSKRGSSSVSAESGSTSRSAGGKKSRETRSSSSSASIEEVSKSSSGSKSNTRAQDRAPRARGSSRKRKRSSSPRNQEATNSKTKDHLSRAPPRRSPRNSASERVQSIERDIPSTGGTGGEVKPKNSAKRPRTTGNTRAASTATASDSSGIRNQQSSTEGKVEKTKTSEARSPVGSRVSAKDNSSPSNKDKGKRREKYRKVPALLSVEESDEGQAKRPTRRKDTGKEVGKESEGEFDRHGRRVTGKSVICEPQRGKGKSTRSTKGKGKARTEVLR